MMNPSEYNLTQMRGSTEEEKKQEGREATGMKDSPCP